MMRRTHWRTQAVGVTLAGLCLSVCVLAAAEEYYTEAEHLILLSGAGTAYTTDYGEALGGQSVYLAGSTLRWETTVPTGTFWLWVRARAGWSQDKTFAWAPEVRYVVRVGGEAVGLEPVPETMEFISDGHNFMWGRAGPLELEAGRHQVTISCGWNWGHVDALLLTDDEGFDPAGVSPHEGTGPSVSRWAAWPVSPYETIDIKAAPPDDPGEDLSATVPVGGTAIMAVDFHTYLDSMASTHFRASMSDLKTAEGATLEASACELYQLTHYRTQRGQVAGDPLVPLNDMGAFTVAPGETTHIWLVVDTRKTAAGTYTGELTAVSQFTFKDERVRLPVSVSIAEPALPERVELDVFNWWGYWDAGEEWWQAQIEGGTNVFKAIVAHHVGFRLDEQGDLVGPLDFTRLDTVVNRVKETEGQLLVEWYLHAKQFAGLTSYAATDAQPLEPFSAAWERGLRALATAIRDHLHEQGLEYGDFAYYTYDEHIGENFIRTGKILRDLDPQIRIFSDSTSSLEAYQAAAPYVDIWCPHFPSLGGQAQDGRLDFMGETGKPIWAYDEGMAQRTRNPYTSYRLKFWLTWKYRLQGCTYWKFQGDDVGIVYYPWRRGAGPVTSRRWEAWKKGLQDYKALVAMRDGGTDPAVLDAAVAEALAAPDDTALADEVLTRLLVAEEAG